MRIASIKVPQILFIYIIIVLAIILCFYNLALEKMKLEEDVLRWQDEAAQFKNELERIKRYSETYNTSPEIISVILRESELRGVKPSIMLELVKTESNYQPGAVSHHGAVGLCQVMPPTARSLSGELGIPYEYELLRETEYNIILGTYYLSKLLTANNGDYHKALTAYNRGPGGLQKYLDRTGTAKTRYSLRISGGSENMAY